MTTLPKPNLIVSFVISTFNRCFVLRDTIAEIYRCGLARDAMEIIVVDNASTDETTSVIPKLFPDITLLPLNDNLGPCAKNLALPAARGRFVVFLDDDSYPQPGAIEAMIRHFDRDPQLGAASFTITLPNGEQECSAYPDVFIGCGVGFRRRALAEVGALPGDFFMQAEEYDLSLRLIDAGWSVQTFDDLHVTHLKTPAARSSSRTFRLDVRNNIVLACRYFPGHWAKYFAVDWTRRYWLIAKSKGRRAAFVFGALQGLFRVARAGNRRTISAEAFEQFAKVRRIESTLRIARDRFGLQKVVFVDLGKNILPYWLAAQRCQLQVVAIADTRLGGSGSTYRGLPIVDDETAASMDFDAAVISNSSPVHARQRLAEWNERVGHKTEAIDLLAPDLAERFTSAVRAEEEFHQTVARSA